MTKAILDDVQNALDELLELNQSLRAVPPDLALEEQYDALHTLMGEIFKLGVHPQSREIQAPHSLMGQRLRKILHLLDYYVTSWEKKIFTAELRSLFYVRSSIAFGVSVFAGTALTQDEAWSFEEFEDFDEELRERLSLEMAYMGEVPEGIPETHWWWFF